MAELAIEVIQRDWPALRGPLAKKPLTTRGNLWFHRHNPRRARGDNCHSRETRSEGRSLVLLEQLGRRDMIDGQLDGPSDDVPIPRLEPIAYSQNSYKYEEERRHSDLAELDADATERAIMFGIETHQRYARERIPDIHARRRFLRDFLDFLEEQIARGDTSAVTQRTWMEHTLELCELESVLYAAA